MWNGVTNDAAWDLHLGRLRGGEVPAYAAPARATDVAGLPPTLTFVGDLDPFHREVVDYVERLRAAGVPVISHVFPGAFHGFDVFVPSAPVSRRARAFVLDGFRAFSATHRAAQPVTAPSGARSEG
jgi:acetyl esterase/lipase